MSCAALGGAALWCFTVVDLCRDKAFIYQLSALLSCVFLYRKLNWGKTSQIFVKLTLATILCQLLLWVKREQETTVCVSDIQLTCIRDAGDLCLVQDRKLLYVLDWRTDTLKVNCSLGSLIFWTVDIVQLVLLAKCTVLVPNRFGECVKWFVKLIKHTKYWKRDETFAFSWKILAHL